MLDCSEQLCWLGAGLCLPRGPLLSVDHGSQLAARHFPSVLQGRGAAGALPSVPS